MKRVGFVGWRGMVGSVLMERMKAEGDFKGYRTGFLLNFPGGRPGAVTGIRCSRCLKTPAISRRCRRWT